MGEIKRVDYLDIAKGLGMLCVIWGHINQSGPICTFFYFFHMPLFFFISGMLFNGNSYNSFRAFIGRKIKSLFLPYVIFSALTWGIWAIYNFITGTQVDSLWLPLLQTLIAQGSQGYLIHNTALWFVPCLIGVECLYFFISKLPPLANIIVCAFAAFMNIMFIRQFGCEGWSSLPWNIDTGLMALPFVSLGNLIVKPMGHSGLKTVFFKYKWLSYSIVIMLLVFLAYSATICPKISMGHSYYGDNIAMFYMRALMGIAIFISFSFWLECFIHSDCAIISKIISYVKWFGKNSFDAMALNVPVKGVVIVCCACILNIPQSEIWASARYSIIPFIITLLILSSMMFIINRWIRPFFHTCIFKQ